MKRRLATVECRLKRREAKERTLRYSRASFPFSYKMIANKNQRSLFSDNRTERFLLSERDRFFLTKSVVFCKNRVLDLRSCFGLQRVCNITEITLTDLTASSSKVTDATAFILPSSPILLILTSVIFILFPPFRHPFSTKKIIIHC